MKLTLLKDEDAGICITDHSIGAEQVAARLAELGLYSDVFYWPNRHELDGPLGLKKIRKLISLSTAQKKRGRFGDYDTLVFFNITYAIYEIANELDASNPPKMCRMEEGLSSCSNGASHSWQSSKLVRAIGGMRNLARKPSLSQSCEDFYCFIPELCGPEFPLKPIRIPSPKENRSELSDILQHVFAFEGFAYPQRYIFFASSTDIDDTPTGETELVLALSRAVGPGNLLVKTHPRDRREVYRDAGIAVMEDSRIPWEVVQLCEDVSDRVLLTCSSGSPLAITALLNDGTKGFYLQPISSTAEQKKNYEVVIEPIRSTLMKLHDLGLCSTIQFSNLDSLNDLPKE